VETRGWRNKLKKCHQFSTEMVCSQFPGGPLLQEVYRAPGRTPVHQQTTVMLRSQSFNVVYAHLCR